MKGRAIEYSEAELAWIKGHRDLPRRQAHAAFVERFGRGDVSLANFNALCKRNGWMTGRTGRYEKGQMPGNKGKAMPPEIRAKCAATMFRKGRMPHTYRGPGHESVDTKDGYVWIIVAETNPYTGADTRRVQKHRYLWEQEHGPVPDGHVLKSLDGDKTNCDPSNWIPVPRALLPRLNGRFGRNYDTAPAELKPVILATAKLAQAATDARKGKRRNG